MRTQHRNRVAAVRPPSGLRTRRVLRPVAGQSFEIDIRPDGNRWLIEIPELGETAEAATRATVELSARECIATRTGIPIGYISVWVRH